MSVRTVTASTTAAGAPAGEEAGRQHEEPGVRVEVAGLARLEGGPVRSEDLGAPRVIGRESRGVRLGQRPVVHRPDSSYLTLVVK